MFATKNGPRSNFQVYNRSQLAGSYVEPRPGDCVAMGMPITSLTIAPAPAVKKKRTRGAAASVAPTEIGKVSLASGDPSNRAGEVLGIVVQVVSNQIVVALPPESVPIRLLGSLSEFQGWGPKRFLYLSGEVDGRVSGAEPQAGNFYRLIAKLPLLFTSLTANHFLADGPEEIWVSLLDGNSIEL